MDDNEVKDHLKGVILLISFIILMILIVLISQLSTTTTSNKIAAGNYIRYLRMEYALRSMYFYSLEYLKLDKELDADTNRAPANVDFLYEPWAAEEGISKIIIEEDSETGQNRVKCKAVIEDCSRKVNLNFLINADGSTNEEVFNILVRIRDRVLTELNVDELVEYYKQRGTPFKIVEELKDIPGITEELLNGTREKPGLLDFVTLWVYPVVDQENPDTYSNPDDWKLNLNTAHRDLLMSISDNITEDIVDALIEYREGVGSESSPEKPRFFSGEEDINTALQDAGFDTEAPDVEQVVNELMERVVFSSKAFTIVVSCMNENSTKKRFYVVEEDEAEDFKVVISHPVTEYIFPDFKEIME